MNRKYIPTWILGLLCLGLAGCPSPLTRTMVVNVKDQTPPVIVISSPAEGSLCANIVEISGTVTDAATSAGNDGQVRSLSYAVPGSVVAGSAAFAPDGGFAFQFPTTTLATSFTVAMAAVDWNGNTGTASLPLQKQKGNGIPSFEVSAENDRATVTWDPVPHTQSYTLYYTTNGSLPSEEVGQTVENAASPCVISGLRNGNMHVFQLRATPSPAGRRAFPTT
ncbi:MAG: fibronectin type III domain-containing protein [Spirochaetales bacterium]|nr:fibronectin type III domain-containing protein [Spirochaetales bacterium]